MKNSDSGDAAMQMKRFPSGYDVCNGSHHPCVEGVTAADFAKRPVQRKFSPYKAFSFAQLKRHTII